MMKEIIENQANEFRTKVRNDFKNNDISVGCYEEMMIFINEIEKQGDDLSVIKMLHVAKMTYIIMK